MTDESVTPNQVATIATNSISDSAMLEEAFSLLRNRRRRYVLHCLKTSRTPMALADVADDLVRWETDASPPAVQDMREEIYISLYHCHLPKLDEAGLINFDTDQNLVDLAEDANNFQLGGGRPTEGEHAQEDLTDNAQN